MLIIVTVLGAALIMRLVEVAYAGRAWPKVAGWWARVVWLNGFQVATVFISGAAWDRYLPRHRPWSADALGVCAGAALGYFAITFVYYWWHRWRHQSPWLWRWIHQIHHSPQRIEVVTSFYKHPLEILINGLISSSVLYLVVGVGPEAAAWAVLLTGLAELFYHWNVATPRWLGYLIQRPESHCVHHEQGVHAYNYADLPLWDMLFGTFKNPARWDARCGLGPENESRLFEMLCGVDVYKTRGRPV